MVWTAAIELLYMENLLLLDFEHFAVVELYD